MKYYFLLLLLFLLGLNASHAQDANQNPNYALSRDKYMAEKDRLSAGMNTTEQNTYKAFDWTTYKAEKKQQKIDRRQERVLARINQPVVVPNCNRGFWGWPRSYWGYYNW
jgi:hypothetical protein